MSLLAGADALGLGDVLLILLDAFLFITGGGGDVGGLFGGISVADTDLNILLEIN